MNSNTLTPDPAIEAWLDSFGVAGELVMLDLNTVNLKASRANQARFDAILPDLVDQYQHAVHSGAVFPPLVITTKGVIIDGNNRHAAMIAEGVTHHPAYVVDVPTSQATVMATSANMLNGQPNTTEERHAHVVYLDRLGVYTQTQIGTMVGYSQSVVAVIVRSASVRERCLNKQAAERVAPTVLTRLADIQVDRVLTSAVETLDATKGTQADATKMAKAVKRARTEEGQLRAIEDIGKEISQRRSNSRKPKGAKRSSLSRFNGARSTILNLNPKAVAAEVNGDASAIRESIASCLDRLVEIDSELA